MSGGSSSSSGDTNQDNSVNLNNGGFVAQNGSTISVTDGGSTKRALEFGGKVMDNAKATTDKSLDSMVDVTANALGVVNDSTANALGIVRDSTADSIDAVRETTNEYSNFSSKALSNIAQSNNKAIDSLKNMAENLKAGVSASMSGTEKTITYAVISMIVLVVLIFIFMMFKGRK